MISCLTDVQYGQHKCHNSQFWLMLLSILLFNLLSCEEKEQVQLPTNPPTVPLYKGEEFKMVIYGEKVDTGKTVYRNPSPDLIIRGKSDSTYLQTSEIDVLDLHVLYSTVQEDGERIITQLTADKGKVDYRTKNFEAWGNVVIIKDNDMRIETEKILWKQSTNSLTTEPGERVVIYKMDGTVEIGRNLKVNMRDGLNTIELEQGLAEALKDETNDGFFNYKTQPSDTLPPTESVTQ